MSLPWTLECSACGRVALPEARPGVCAVCGRPYLVRYTTTPPPDAKARLHERPWTMWRYREWLPLAPDESPITLGEGATPLLKVERIGARRRIGDGRDRHSLSSALQPARRISDDDNRCGIIRRMFGLRLAS